MPPGLVTVMLLGPITAVVVVLKVALICVGLTMVTPVTVRPFAGATTLTVDPAVKLLPVRTTATGLAAAAVRRRPELGVIELRIGVPGFTTVKVTGVVGAASRGYGYVSCGQCCCWRDDEVRVDRGVTDNREAAVTVMPPPVTAIPVAGFVPVRKLMPVSVTAWVVPRAPVVGVIENSPAGGTVTVKVTALLVPPGAMTVTFLAPAVAPAEMLSVAVTVVSLTFVKPVTVMPLPETLISTVPVNPVPVSVTGKPVVPRLAEAGTIEVSIGPVIANGRVLLAPPAVTTPIFTEPSAALKVLVMVAVMVVLLTTTTLLIVTPGAAGVTTTVAPVTKFVPVSVTLCAWPRNSDAGEMDVNVGAGGAMTVNVPAFVVPAGVVTVTFLAPNVAFGAMVKVAVTVVAFTAVTALTVIPVPLTFTALARAKLVPVMVTFTTVPCTPVLGEIDAMVPTPLPFWNSTAPTSKWFGLAGSGRGFP